MNLRHLIRGKTTLKVSDNLEGQVLSKFTLLRRAQDTVWAYPPTASLCQGCNTPGVSHSALRECGQWSDSADTGFCLHLQALPMVRKDKGCTKGESDFEIWGFWSFNYKAQGNGILSQEKQKTKQGARRVLLNCFSRRWRAARREAEWMRVEATEMRGGGTQDPMAPLQVIQSFIRWGRFHRPPSTVHFHVAVTCSWDVRTQFLRRFEEKKNVKKVPLSKCCFLLFTSANTDADNLPSSLLTGWIPNVYRCAQFIKKTGPSPPTPARWGRPSVIQQTARGFARPWPCPKALLETSRPWEWGSEWGYGGWRGCFGGAELGMCVAMQEGARGQSFVNLVNLIWALSPPSMPPSCPANPRRCPRFKTSVQAGV